jgi:hypothetical protein
MQFDGIDLDKAAQSSTSSTYTRRNSSVRVLDEVRRAVVQDIAVLHALLTRGWNGGNQGLSVFAASAKRSAAYAYPHR